MKLWRENKVAQEYEISHREIASGFLKSHYSSQENRDSRSLRYLLTLYICSKDGLNSTLDDNPDEDLTKIEFIVQGRSSVT